jgi:hypothetical protein
MIEDITYIVGDLVNGDYVDEYETYEEAKSAYEDCVEEGLEAEAASKEEDEAMDREEVAGFYYILKVTKELIEGGDYED